MLNKENLIDRLFSILDWIIEDIVVPLIVAVPIVAIMFYIFIHNGICINTITFILGMISIWCFGELAKKWFRNR